MSQVEYSSVHPETKPARTPLTLASVESRTREILALTTPDKAAQIVNVMEEYFMAPSYGTPIDLFGNRRDRIESKLARIMYACAGQSVTDIHIALTMAEIRSLGGSFKRSLNS